MSPGPPYRSGLRERLNDDALKGSRIMMPYDTYRLYQIERAKSPAEVRRADDQAARLASAASSLFQSIMRPSRVRRRPSRTPRCSRCSRVSI